MKEIFHDQQKKNRLVLGRLTDDEKDLTFHLLRSLSGLSTALLLKT